jgi:hypothetical protein
LWGVHLGDTDGHFLRAPLIRLGLTDLELPETDITDRIGPNIACLESLATLDLRGTEVSDAIIPYLEKLPFLMCVDLSGTKVTPIGIDELRRAKPGLVIGLRAGKE